MAMVDDFEEVGEVDIEPLFGSPATPGLPSRLGYISALMRYAGHEPMPWQRDTLRRATQLKHVGGPPSWREVVMSVCRRGGKTDIALFIMFDRATLWPKPQVMSHGLQTIGSTLSKWEDEFRPLLEECGLWQQAGMRIFTNATYPRVEFANGSLIRLLSSSRKAGHSQYNDLVLLDEVWAMKSATAEEALVPTIRTSPWGQIILMSAEGDEESEYWENKVDTLRPLTTSTEPQTSCLIEYAADPRLDWRDPQTWRTAVVNLGHTVSMEALEHEFRTVDERSFRRFTLNQRVRLFVGGVIPATLWQAVEDVDVAPRGEVWLAADADPDRNRGFIAAADAEGRCEMVATQAGVHWIGPALERMCAVHPDVVGVVWQETGPLSTLELDEHIPHAVEIRLLSPDEVNQACVNLYDEVVRPHDPDVDEHPPEPPTVRIEPEPNLQLALRSSRRLYRGGLWRWGRIDDTANVSPLYVVSMGLFAATEPSGETAIINLADA